MMGPRELPADTSLDDLEDEIVHTCAALKADPNAEDLAASFEPQLPLLDGVRTRERSTRRAKVESSAFSGVADSGLDRELVATGRDLLAFVNGDRSKPTWTKVFGNSTPTDITRLPRSVELDKSKGIIGTTRNRPRP